MAKQKYGKWDPRHYLLRHQAKKFAFLCQRFGRGCWNGALSIAAAVLLTILSGCTMVDSITAATAEKSVALGSDTWGGGAEISLAAPEQPFPTLSGWFGRRRVWYTSIRDRESGEAAAEVVRASHTAISVEAGADGVGVSQASK